MEITRRNSVSLREQFNKYNLCITLDNVCGVVMHISDSYPYSTNLSISLKNVEELSLFRDLLSRMIESIKVEESKF